MIYLAQVTLYTGLLLAVYTLLLRNNKQYGWSRAFLLLGATLPVVLPFLQLPMAHTPLLPQALTAYTLPVYEAGTPGHITKADTLTMAGVLYLFVSITFLAPLVGPVLWLARMRKKGEVSKQGNICLITHTGAGPGSFGKTVFFPEGDINPSILQHELAHCRMSHSADLVLLYLLRACFWPNVFLHLLIRETKTVHEFQADEQANAADNDYSSVLLGTLFGTKQHALFHTFFTSSIKRRLMMLTKKPGSNRQPTTLSSIALTVLSASIILFQTECKQTIKPEVTRSENDTTDVALKAEIMRRTEEYSRKHRAEAPDVMPAFKGDIMTYLSEHIRYPEEARKRKIEGRVLVQFVVTKTGKITNPKILKSPDPLLSEAALAAIVNMPDWSPAEKDGKAIDFSYVQPISFKMD